jgi:hypothetical protein
MIELESLDIARTATFVKTLPPVVSHEVRG